MSEPRIQVIRQQKFTFNNRFFQSIVYNKKERSLPENVEKENAQINRLLDLMCNESDFIGRLNERCEEEKSRATRRYFKHLIRTHEKIYNNLNDSYRLHVELINKRSGFQGTIRNYL